MAQIAEPFFKDESLRVAQNLINQFGCLSGVLAATPEQISDVEGTNREFGAYIESIGGLVESSFEEDYLGKPILPLERSFLRHLRFSFGSLAEEVLAAQFLDSNGCSKGGLQIIGFGTGQYLTSRLGHLMRRAFDLRSNLFLLIHNHPSAECTPSGQDKEATRRIREVANQLDVHLADHLIVTKKAVFSMRQGRKL